MQSRASEHDESSDATCDILITLSVTHKLAEASAVSFCILNPRGQTGGGAADAWLVSFWIANGFMSHCGIT